MFPTSRSRDLPTWLGERSMTISRLLEDIESGLTVLPAIQRDFVWDDDKITYLFDSIIRGYPIGIVLLWETYNDILHRPFSKDYIENTQYTFRENTRKKRIQLVLDGQQRLQSLYVSVHGTHEGRYLCFNVLSGRESEDFEERKYVFEFLDKKELKEYNRHSMDLIKEDGDDFNDWDEIEYFCRIMDLLSKGYRERMDLEMEITNSLRLPDADQLRLRMNLGRLVEALTVDEYILKSSIIDENKTRDSKDCKSESDVLEAFVRINREGIQLSRSDLIFSLLKLKWKEAALALPEFVREVNKGNNFELDADFVIRCLYTVSDLGTRFDVDTLRKTANVELIMHNFDKCCKAIRSTVDFAMNQCWISSSRLLRTYHNLIPIVYYLFHTPKHLVPNNQVDNVRKSLFLFGFTSPFSRWVDSRLWKFIRLELKERIDQGDFEFPLRDAVAWIHEWERVDCLGPEMLSGNSRLVLHLIQRRTADKVQYELNAPQIDHIFPRSKLRDMGHEKGQIDHFANFWIMAAGKNRNKSNRHPSDYFADVSESDLKRALIDRDMLDYRKFRRFIREREERLIKGVRKELDLSEDDYDYYALWPDIDDE